MSRLSTSSSCRMSSKLLPFSRSSVSHTVKWDKVSTPEEAFDAIKSMKVSSQQ